MNILAKPMSFASASLLIAGCATASLSQLEEGLANLMGRNEQAAFAALGPPSDKASTGETTVYTWKTSHVGKRVVPENTSTAWDVNRTSAFKNTMYSQTEPFTHTCSIDIVADRNGVLKTWKYEGSAEGCGPYARMIGKR